MNKLTDHELDQEFAEQFDEFHDGIQILDMEYSAIEVLRKIDPVAYRQEFLFWLDSEVQEGRIIEKDGEYFTNNNKGESDE